jgi:hypothetical protein
MRVEVPMTKEQVREAAMTLAPEDRESLAEDLLLSLSEIDLHEVDRRWLQIARQRDAEFRASGMSAAPAEDVIQRLLNRGRQ